MLLDRVQHLLFDILCRNVRLESVANAQSNTGPTKVDVQAFTVEEIHGRTPVERYLDRQSLEVVLQTSLTNYAEVEISVAVVRCAPGVETKHTAYAGIPTEVRNGSNGTFPLVDTVEAEVKIVDSIGGRGGETKVEFETIGSQILLIAQFGTETTIATEAYTDCLLCVCCNTHGENCHKGQ